MKLSTVLMAAALVFSASLVEDAAAFRPLRDGTSLIRPHSPTAHSFKALLARWVPSNEARSKRDSHVLADALSATRQGWSKRDGNGHDDHGRHHHRPLILRHRDETPPSDDKPIETQEPEPGVPLDPDAEEGDLIETEPVVVPQNYTTADALEEAARNAGPAIFSELSSDASQFGVGGAQTLVVIAAVAGAVAIVFGVLIALVGALRPSQVVLDDCRSDAVETGSVQILPRILEESEDPEETAEQAQERAQEEQEGTFLNGNGPVPV
ncbi:hypothetical protein P43SY_009018 [Pythium insidiosum]|uniref:Transmembrane protein n=1 Tax=Pythium insidiosum TaxID=114742 RepID=A0AAD5M426_PYTIN|nr:hypothetical protein P43SY_009018 [Pythium insidiosum]